MVGRPVDGVGVGAGDSDVGREGTVTAFDCGASASHPTVRPSSTAKPKAPKKRKTVEVDLTVGTLRPLRSVQALLLRVKSKAVVSVIDIRHLR